jgi:GT2 family glycosyltransferase
MVAFGGGWTWVARALDALRRSTSEPYEVILIDNGGAEDRSIPADARVEIIRNDANVGFGPGSNQGAAQARADVLCFLNTDAFVETGWLPPILDRLADDRVGAVVPLKLNVDGSVQEAGAFVTREAHAYVFGDGDDADAPQHNFARDLDFGSAACMLVTRRRFESTGGFDPGYRLSYFEDADFCFRLREDALRVVLEPRSRVTHVRTVSTDAASLADIYSANREVFLSRWRAAIEERPGLNQLQNDPRSRLAARDFHAHDRVLLLDGTEPFTRRLSVAIASGAPSARVTLLVKDLDVSSERELLAAGVEVVQSVREEEWLTERSGHYSHVLAGEGGAQGLKLRVALRQSQPEAAFVDVARLEPTLESAPLTEILSSLGIEQPPRDHSR